MPCERVTSSRFRAGNVRRPKFRHVTLTRAKRRDFYGRPETLVKVVTKLPLCDHLANIAVRGGDYPDIDLDRLRRANRFNFSLLKNTQQF